MGAHVGRIGAMAQGRVPFDAKAAADNAAIVSAMARLPFTAFGEGTDKGMPNRAKPEIWKDAAKFKAASDKMVAEIAKLETAAKAGNLDAIKAAMGGVGGSCKGCHDDFRAEKYSAN
jgi:cytochrome c556